MNDIITIAEAFHGQVRIHAAYTKNLVEKARINHGCYPTSAAALGRTMTVAAIMASDLKNSNEKIETVINGHGPAGTILVQAKGNGDVRGFIGDPEIYISREDGHLDVGKAVGKEGYLRVIRDMGLKEPFTGVVEIESGEIGQDFANYFAISEQTPSIVSVGVLVEVDQSIKVAGGFIIQMMPEATEETISECEEMVKHLRPMTDLLQEGMTPDEIIMHYFNDATILDHKDVRWHCDCSRERFRAGLATLKDSDLQEMIEDGKGAEIRCEFCNSYYQFNTEDLKEILDSKHVQNWRA